MSGEAWGAKLDIDQFQLAVCASGQLHVSSQPRSFPFVYPQQKFEHVVPFREKQTVVAPPAHFQPSEQNVASLPWEIAYAVHASVACAALYVPTAVQS
jgi:hypothetical protein